MPPRASVVDLAPSKKRKNSIYDVTNFIQKRALGHRKADWRGNQLFDPRFPRNIKPKSGRGSIPRRDHGDDVFAEIRRYKDGLNVETKDAQMSSEKAPQFRLSCKKEALRQRIQTAVVSLDQSQPTTEAIDEMHEASEVEPKQLPRLPVSRGSMFGRFKT